MLYKAYLMHIFKTYIYIIFSPFLSKMKKMKKNCNNLCLCACFFLHIFCHFTFLLTLLCYRGNTFCYSCQKLRDPSLSVEGRGIQTFSTLSLFTFIWHPLQKESFPLRSFTLLLRIIFCLLFRLLSFLCNVCAATT